MMYDPLQNLLPPNITMKEPHTKGVCCEKCYIKKDLGLHTEGEPYKPHVVKMCGDKLCECHHPQDWVQEGRAAGFTSEQLIFFKRWHSRKKKDAYD